MFRCVFLAVLVFFFWFGFLYAIDWVKKHSIRALENIFEFGGLPDSEGTMALIICVFVFIATYWYVTLYVFPKKEPSEPSPSEEEE